jgi:hypothetical protein
MAIKTIINGITGQSPYNIYVCQPNGSGCYFIATTSVIPYQFDVPPPGNTSSAYMLKVIDANNCTITGVTSVVS